MATIRRHAPWLAPITLVLLLVMLIWVQPVPPAAEARPAAALRQEGFAPLDPVNASRLAELRRSAGLDDDVLTAMNLSANELLQSLTALRNWYESNATQFQARRQAIAEQQQAIRLHASGISLGRAELEALQAARQRVAQLEAEWEVFLAGCRTAVLGNLSQPAQTLAAQMRSSALPMPYRVLTLSAEQNSSLRQAMIRYEQRRSTAPDDEGRESARQTFDQDLAAALGSENVTVLSALRAALGPASERVVAALQTVLREQEPGL